MPIPVTPKPLYPNVPQAPGVPPLLRQIGQVQATVVLAVADATLVLGALGLTQTPQWGLFTSAGAPAFSAAASGLATVLTNLLAGGSGQSIGDLEFRLDHRVATAPQEQGAFLSYNKVSTPFEGRVTYLISGTVAQRTQFFAEVLAAQKSLALFSLVMPEYSYPSCTIDHQSFRRTARNGVTLVAVDIWVEEVRVTGTAAYSTTTTPTGTTTASGGGATVGSPGNTASPTGAPQVNGGTTQPQTITPGQASGLPAGPSTDLPSTGSAGPASPGATGAPGGAADSTAGVPAEPYFDDNGTQIGVAPSTTPATGPVVGSYSNGQPVVGGTWQQGFYDQNMTWQHQ